MSHLINTRRFLPCRLGQEVWAAIIPGTTSVAVHQAMIWGLVPVAVTMVASNCRKVWASKPEDLPEEERGFKTVSVACRPQKFARMLRVRCTWGRAPV